MAYNNDRHFIGSIILFTDSFVPKNWFKCDGTTLNAQDYPPLFSVLERYTQDKETFDLPNIPSPIEGFQYIICYNGDYPTMD